jgi:hypothetical protein
MMTTTSLHSAAQNSKSHRIPQAKAVSDCYVEQFPLLRSLISGDAKQVNEVDVVCPRPRHILVQLIQMGIGWTDSSALGCVVWFTRYCPISD